ncbi:MAG: riboflavin biosynthesis protein RibF [Planctomycetaceae bacterium]|nr:riboflavin biosynthesis protein RibF [Planctomycetaceae bacterium]
MKLIRDLNDLPSELRGGAVSIGNFDGVHRGHARIVEQLRAQAALVDGPLIVFTFDPHPVRLLRPDKVPPPLTWTDRKAELLRELAVDALVVYPTDEHLLSLTPDAFFREIVVQRLDARAMIEGPNFFFGKDRAGDIDVLGELCQTNGVTLNVVEPLVAGESYVSSSRIRDLIRDGEVAEATKLLTRPYRIRGMVTHGAARGAKLGFPTANIDAIDTILPKVGVYAGRAITFAGTWPTAVNIGPNPTFGEDVLKVEAHLIGYSDSLYGQPLEVDFLARVRDTREFASVEDLKQQLQNDIQTTSHICMRAGVGESGRVGEE